MSRSDLVWTDDSPLHLSFFDAVSTTDPEGLRSILTTVGAGFNIDMLKGDGTEGLTALHLACEAGHAQIVQLLLESGANTNCPNVDPWGSHTPLHSSAAMGNGEISRLLLDHGADPTVLDGNGATALELIFHHYPQAPAESPSRLELYQLLLDRGPHNSSGVPFLTDRQLHSVVIVRDTSLVQILLDNGHDIQIPDLEGTTSVLCSAITSESLRMLQLLIDHGSHVKYDALHQASHGNQQKILELLFRFVDESVRSTCDALPIACSHGNTHLDMVRFLVEAGCNVNQPDSRGDYPLLLASESNNAALDVVSLLLGAGADIDVRSPAPYKGSMIRGDTALHRAAWRCDPGVYELLLSAGGDVTAVNEAGETPLIALAVHLNRQTGSFHQSENAPHPRLTAIRLLLQSGSHVNAKDLKGRTAAHVLVSDEYAEPAPGFQVMALKELLDAGATISSASPNDENLLDLAHRKRKKGIVKFLNEYELASRSST